MPEREDCCLDAALLHLGAISLGVTRRTKNGSHFWSGFGLGFSTKMGSKITPRLIKNGFKQVLFLGFVFRGFGALQVTLGNLLELPEALLGGLWTPKP